MSAADTQGQRERLEQAIAAQEKLRGIVDDAIIDATIATLQAQLASLQPTQQQRKLATILFMDIAGHTALTRDLDPEVQMEVVDAAIARLATQVSDHAGRVTRYQGDGFKAVFGLPVASEHDPENAIQSGLAIQAEANAIAADLQATHDLGGFSVRVGVNTGSIFSGGETEGEDTIKGMTVNLAARLESAAEPGWVLISHDTYKHVRGIFDFEPQDPIQAKGFAEPVPVYRVLRAKPRAFYRSAREVEGVETQMVGRAGEFKALQDGYEIAREDDQLQMLTLVGEAGLGKSRLLYEFENWVDLQPEAAWLFEAGLDRAPRTFPYALLRNALAFRFAIQDDDPAEIVQEKLLSGLAAGLGQDSQLEMKGHFIGRLLGYGFEDSPHLAGMEQDPQQLRDRTVMYLVEYFAGLAASELVLILLEDIHWADDSSLDACNQLFTRLAKEPVLVVNAARPALYERRAHWGEGQTFHIRLDLRPLSKLDSRRLVGQILQKVDDLPDSLRDLVVENSEGNPFYLEELIKMLVEQGAIEKGEERWRVITSQLARVQVPETLTGVLQARLDRLAREERTLLQQASVVGRIFWDLLLVSFQKTEGGGGGQTEVLEALDALRGHEMVFRRETSAFGKAIEHIFKHDLLREVTYESVLLSLRRRYHSLAADWLIENSRDQRLGYTGLIADHLVQAERKAEALVFLQQAGEEAAAAYAQEESVAAFSQALELADAENLEQRWALLAAREQVYDFMGLRKQQAADLEALQELGQELADPRKRAEAALRLANYEQAISNYSSTIDFAQQAIEFTKISGDQVRAGRGYFYLGRAYWRKSDYPKAQSAAEAALALAIESKDQRTEGHALRLLGIIVTEHQKDFVLRDAYYGQSLEIARKTGDRRGELNVLNNIGVASMERGTLNQAGIIFQEALSIARAIGDRQMEKKLYNNHGVIARDLGNFTQSAEYFLRSYAIGREIDDRSGELYAFTNLGSVAVYIGNYAEAEKYCEKALAIARDIGDRVMEGTNYSYLGYVANFRMERKKASDYYHQALAIFQEIGRASHVPGALLDLSKVLIAQGRPVQAVKKARAALRLCVEMDDPIWIIASRVELARALVAQRDLSLAYEEVELILAYVDEGRPLDILENPVRIYLTCYEILKEVGNERAAEMLATGHALLMARVDRITDEADRRSYLENVPWHRELLELWEARVI